MNRFVVGVMVGAICCFAGQAPAQEGFESLFNGKDLTGWDGNPELWSVEDGAITGKTRGPGQLTYNQFLVWTGGTVGDFELKVDVRLEGENNSGVQYRSQRRPDIGNWSVAGYQADWHPNPSYTGMLYDERGRGIVAQRGQKVTISQDGKKAVASLEVPVEPVDVDQWHELTIIAKGNHLTHKIDGVTTIEVIDEQESERELEGVLAFQVHQGPAMKVQFKNVRLKKFETEAKQESQKKKQPDAKSQQPEAKKAEKKKASTEHPSANWIWADAQGKQGKKAFFRKEIKVRGPVETARLFVSADDQMTVFLNGTKVAQHAGHTNAQYVDLSKHFKDIDGAKDYVVAVQAVNNGGPGAMLLELDLESGWRKTERIVTDDSWLASEKPAKNWQQPGFDAKEWQAAKVVRKLGQDPYPLTQDQIHNAAKLREPEATPIDRLVIAKDFKVELLYSVPKEVQGSWVSMCVDPRGRLIVCDQYGGLFRITLPALNESKGVEIEKIDVDIGEAQGLLWAFDSLYVVVNKGGKYESGLYRVRDTDGDDKLDSLETLRLLPGSGGEHGPHAVLLSPDQKSLYVVCGDKTDLTEFDASRVPRIWDEDTLLPRVYGKGFMKGVPAPGGYISKVDPDGKSWELVAVGFRNQYDADFNADGELFTYDADMEWDLNTPWYRPTRVCQVLSGVDYGWRNGSAKFPEYYPETPAPVVNIGPGSPTGVCFGYNAKFPAKYQKALFINDWSYGKLYAVHLDPQGASYTGKAEEFITGTPLPLTDIVVNPHDGAMYFAIGGRKVQSGLYRVTYVGSEATDPVDAKNKEGAEARAQLRKLEALHLGDHPDAVEIAWPYLSSDDPVLRSAARIAIEHRPVSEWKEKAFNESNPVAKIESLLALCRKQERTTKKPQEAVDTVPPVWDESSQGPEGERGELQAQILTALSTIEWDQLETRYRLAGLRVLELAMLRLGAPAPEVRDEIIAYLDKALPAETFEENTMLLDVLVFLQAPQAAAKGMQLLNAAPSQEEQILYAKALSYLRDGWTPELRESYFQWFVKASGFRGGVGFDLFVNDIRKQALSHLNDEQKLALKPILDKKLDKRANPLNAEPRPFVKDWTMEELLPLVQDQLTGRDFEHGRKMFGAANCFACHRFAGEGGAVGPDLTGLAGRFDARAILESVLEPSKVISDQYAAVQIQTIHGKVIVGRIVNLAGDVMRINTDMLDPNAQEAVDRREIEAMIPSKTSMMPKGLLNTLNQNEVLDLMAFLLSRGDASNPMFKENKGEQAAR